MKLNETHGNPWEPKELKGTHGNPWEPKGTRELKGIKVLKKWEKKWEKKFKKEEKKSKTKKRSRALKMIFFYFATAFR